MAVVDDIFLIRPQLNLMDGSETVQQQRPFSAGPEDKKSFASEQAAGEALHLAIEFDGFGARKESVLLHHVLVDAVELQHDNFTRNRRRQEHLAWPASRSERLEKELFTAEEFSGQCPEKSSLHLTLDINGRGRGDHCAGFCLDGLAASQLHPHHRKGTRI